MDKCREEFQKAFPIPAHWIEFDEKTNRYYCPYVADATASKYQSQWVVWQHLYEKMGGLETAIDSLSDENAHFRNKKWDQNEDFTKLQAKVKEANAKAQMCRDEKNHAINRWSAVCKERDELQKRVEWLEDRLKATDTLSKMRAAVIGSFNSQEFNARTRRKMMILKRAEQALKGEG
ncbi:hypothetical protein ABFO98_17525 [Acinetobacter baumannii]